MQGRGQEAPVTSKRVRASCLEHLQHTVEIFTQSKIEPLVKESLCLFDIIERTNDIWIIQETSSHHCVTVSCQLGIILTH